MALASYREGIRSVYFIISLDMSNNLLYVSYRDHFYREIEDFVASNFDGKHISIYKRDWFRRFRTLMNCTQVEDSGVKLIETKEES